MARKPITIIEAMAGFFRLIRYSNLLLIAFTQYLTKICLIDDIPFSWAIFSDFRLFLLVASTIFIAAAGYIINDYYDVKIDIINKPNRVVIGRYVKRRIAIGSHQVLSIMGILIGLYLSKWIALVNFVSVVCLWLYSNQLKRMAFWGNLMVAWLTALSVIVVALYYRQHEEEVYAYALFSFGISLIREIIKDMEDVRGDANFGCKTLPILWGIRRTKYLLYILLLLLVGSLLSIGWGLRIMLPLSISFVLILWLTIKLVRADTRRDFAYLSMLCKIIMLLGVLSMIGYGVIK
jgi:4-hydroxybenzoate polyprenyltransferase